MTEPFVPAISEPGTAAPPDWTVPELGTAVPGSATPAAPDGPAIGESLKIDDKPAEKPKEKPEEDATCKHCQRDLASLRSMVKPTEEDKKAWMRHILGEERFRKEFVLMGGKLKVTMRSRTAEETDLIFQQLNRDAVSGIIPNIAAFANPTYYARLHRITAVISLDRIELEQAGPNPVVFPPIGQAYTASEGKSLVEVAEPAIIGRIKHEAVVNSVTWCARAFEGICRELLERMNDSNFWKTAGG